MLYKFQKETAVSSQMRAALRRYWPTRVVLLVKDLLYKFTGMLYDIEVIVQHFHQHHWHLQDHNLGAH